MKIPTTPTITSAITNAKIQTPAPLTGQIDQIKAKLGHLKERLEVFDGQVIADAGARFKENAFGSATVGNGVGSFFEQVASSGRSKNPLDGAVLGNFSGGGLGHYSADPAPADAPAKDSEDFDWGAFFTSVGEGVVGAFVLGGEIVAGLLTGPHTVETVTGNPGDLLRGVEAVAKSGDKDPEMNAILDGMDKEPTPDSDGSGAPTVITNETLRGIAARRGNKGEPANDDSGGSSGAGGVAAPKTTQQGEWVNDGAGASVVVNSIALKGIEAKINANITIIH